MLLIDSEMIDSYEVIDALARLLFGCTSESSTSVFPSLSFSSSSSAGSSTCSLLSVLATVGFPLALDSFSKTSSNVVSNLPPVGAVISLETFSSELFIEELDMEEVALAVVVTVFVPRVAIIEEGTGPPREPFRSD